MDFFDIQLDIAISPSTGLNKRHWAWMVSGHNKEEKMETINMNGMQLLGATAMQMR